jgi:VanZ family protein
VTPGTPANPLRHPAVARAAWWWGPVVAYAAVIFILSSISQPPSLPQIVTDKDLHGGLYGGFALVVLRALARRWERVTLLTALGAIVAAILYGISDEFHQSFVPGRTSDVADVIADGTGAAVAVVVAWLVARFGVRSTSARSLETAKLDANESGFHGRKSR